MKDDVIKRMIAIDELLFAVVKEELSKRNDKDWDINKFATFDNFRRQNLESLYKASAYLNENTFKTNIK